MNAIFERELYDVITDAMSIKGVLPHYILNKIIPIIEKQTEPKPEPNGYTLISVDGKAQKVVDRIALAPKPVQSYASDIQRMVWAEDVPVVCIMERE